MGLTELIRQVQAGDRDAFTHLVQMHQDSAYAYAFSILNDFHHAQDAVQESFISVYYQIGGIRNPDAFPAWLRTIIRRQCYRAVRRSAIRNISLESAESECVDSRTPDRGLEDRESIDQVIRAVCTLPQSQRETVILYYMKEHSQKDVALFLGVPESTVNNRLHAARKALKRRMIEMVDSTLSNKSLPDDFAKNIGEIVRVQGPIAEARTANHEASMLFDTWKVDIRGQKTTPAVSVIQRHADGRIVCVNTGETSEISPNTRIEIDRTDSIHPLADDRIREVIQTVGLESSEKPRFRETGIKVIDLICPLPDLGNVGFFGGQGIGRAILASELHRRVEPESGKLAVFYFASKSEAYFLRELIEREANFPPDIGANLQTAWLVTQRATDPEFPDSIDSIDSVVYFSPLIAVRQLYPAIDCSRSSSRLLQPQIVGNEHCEIAKRVVDILEDYRTMMTDPQFIEYVAIGANDRARLRAEEHEKQRIEELSDDERVAVSRAQKIQHFLTQPLYVAESFTGIPAKRVPVGETIRCCRMILDGELDHIPVNAFKFIGELEDVMRQAEK